MRFLVDSNGVSPPTDCALRSSEGNTLHGLESERPASAADPADEQGTESRVKSDAKRSGQFLIARSNVDGRRSEAFSRLGATARGDPSCPGGLPVKNPTPAASRKSKTHALAGPSGSSLRRSGVPLCVLLDVTAAHSLARKQRRIFRRDPRDHDLPGVWRPAVWATSLHSQDVVDPISGRRIVLGGGGTPIRALCLADFREDGGDEPQEASLVREAHGDPRSAFDVLAEPFQAVGC